MVAQSMTSQQRLREALTGTGPGNTKEKGTPKADGTLTKTPDTQEAQEWKSRRSPIDSAGASSSYLQDAGDSLRQSVSLMLAHSVVISNLCLCN